MSNSIPESCTVLVVGGGPAGSYAASVLGREGIDTVLLEADSFPRYHIGESLLPSMKYFLQFIDLYDKFDAHGFLHKNGATFKFNSKNAGFTDFLAAGGAGNHSWNVVRSEADHLLFKHAGESGAKTFDKTKVTSIEFEPTQKKEQAELGRPVSASWQEKDTGATGSIKFQYLIDASGRAGMISTKYAKTRKYNPGLKSVAAWGYWENGAVHGPGVGDPFFEATKDGSGWVWYIPLHNGTVSVGIAIRQHLVAAKKKAIGATSTWDYYNHVLLQETVGIAKLLKNASPKSQDIKTASDWSYHSTEYASPYVRIAGDAGCFVDPLFSSGVHLAVNSGLSAALSICASMRGDCTEKAAVSWHTQKVAEGYTRFLLIVTSSLEQIYGQEQPILNDLKDTGFDHAFDIFKPVIQGTVDAGGNLTKEEIAKSVEFCTNVIAKIDGGKASAGPNAGGEKGASGLNETARIHEKIETPMMKIVNIQRVLDLDTFTGDVVDGMVPKMSRGQLGLRAAA